MVGRHPDPLMLTYVEETKRKPYNVCEKTSSVSLSVSRSLFLSVFVSVFMFSVSPSLRLSAKLVSPITILE